MCVDILQCGTDQQIAFHKTLENLAVSPSRLSHLKRISNCILIVKFKYQWFSHIGTYQYELNKSLTQSKKDRCMTEEEAADICEL